MLDEGSLVVDGGAYRGEFAAGMIRRHGSRVIAYELVPEYALALQRAMAAEVERGVLQVIPRGLSDRDGRAVISVRGTLTGLVDQEARGSVGDVEVRFLDAADELACYERIDLLKLNIEGAEYGVLERLLESGVMSRIRGLLVQFHRVGEGYADRYDMIAERLSDGFRLMWREPWKWEAWSR